MKFTNNRLLQPKHPYPHTNLHQQNGFTLIELMIVLAVVAIILTLAIPTYSNYTIRGKVAEGLSLANAAKTAIAATCEESRTITDLNNNLAGYGFQPTDYVASIALSGPCTAPVITILTQNTGADSDPTLTITGNFTAGSGHVSWLCVSSGLNLHVPDICRS